MLEYVLVYDLFPPVQVSDLLREQLFLQSELNYDGCAPSTNPSSGSSRSSSPVRGGGGGGGSCEQRQNIYRASINITPAPPPRPNTYSGEEEEEERGTDSVGGGGRGGVPEEEGAAGGIRVENLQQLIREVTVCQQFNRKLTVTLITRAYIGG